MFFLSIHQIQQYNFRIITISVGVVVTKLIFMIATFHFLTLEAFADRSSFNLGMTRGGISIGGEYETAFKNRSMLGGYFQVTPKNDDELAPGLTSITAFLRTVFGKVSPAEFYVKAGIGLYIYDSLNGDSKSLIGPALGYGIDYAFNRELSLGAENLTHWSWLGDPTGLLGYDFFLLKISLKI